MANLIYTSPPKGNSKFWDFYALEALNASVKMEVSNPNNQFKHSLIKLKNSVYEVYEQCATQLLNNMMIYLRAEIEDEMGYALNGNVDNHSEYIYFIEELHPILYAYYKVNKLLGTDSSIVKKGLKEKIKKVKYDNGISKNLPAGTILKMYIHFISQGDLDYPEDDNAGIKEYNEYCSKLQKNQLTNDMFNILLETTKGQDTWEQFTYQDLYNIFNEKNMWETAYGGPSWAEVTRVFAQYSSKYKTMSLPEKSMLIDKIYDMEHNSGQVLNKDNSLSVYDGYLRDRYQSIKVVGDYFLHVELLSPIVISLLKRYRILTQPAIAPPASV
jgi:hypothetical protein